MQLSPPNIRLPIHWLLLTLIILVAAVLRLVQLGVAPPGGHGDVAWIGINALDWADRGVWAFYIRELYAPEFLPVYLTGLLLPFTGVSYLPQRLVTAMMGVLFVALLYPATYWLIGPKAAQGFRIRAGLLAAFAGAVSLHIVGINRLGMESPPFLTVLALLTWLTAMAWWQHGERGTYWRWGWAGAALALAQYVYLPARLLPLMLLLWIGYGFIAEPGRTRLRGWVVMGVIAFIFTLPALILFAYAPEAFSGRADSGTATTGGWIWDYDMSQYGGVASVLIQKVGLTLRALIISQTGPYNFIGQPILSPIFAVGLLLALYQFVRQPRALVYAWPLIAMPVLLITDLISGAVPEVHTLHQMGILPFVAILAGAGLAGVWEWRWVKQRRVIAGLLVVGITVLGIAPAALGMSDYLNRFVPARLADPQFSWRGAQTDLDIGRRIAAAPDQAYLLPYSEYVRPDVAWTLAAAFRERRSAIDDTGTLQIANPPQAVTVVQPTEPERLRHDGYPAHADPRLWVLLHEGAVYLLPSITQAQTDVLINVLAENEGEPLVDRSGITVAHFTELQTPADLFSPRAVVQFPLEATFDGRVQLLGYSLPSADLVPGTSGFVTFYWQALQPLPVDYEVFAQMWTSNGDAVASAHDYPFSGMYRSRLWRTDEVLATHHYLALPETMAEGRYTLVGGLFRYLLNENVAIEGANADVTLRVARAPDLRVPRSSLPLDERGTPPVEPLQFEELLRVAGLQWFVDDEARDQQPLTARAGQPLTLTLDWEALADLTTDYSLFVHLSADDAAPPVAQFDELLGATYPTGAWRNGDIVRTEATLQLPANLPNGEYSLFIGVYDLASGTRLAPIQGNSSLPDGRYRLGTISVE